MSMRLSAILLTAIAFHGSKVVAVEGVSIEIVQDARGPIDGPQQWIHQLRRHSLSAVRIRSPRPGDRPRIEKRGTPARPSYHVTAVLTSRNQLKVPGAVFRLGETQRFAKWLDDLGDSATPKEVRDAFDLTDRERARLMRDLRNPFPSSTVDRKPIDIVRVIQQQSPRPVVIAASARARLAKAAKLADELEGLALGTTLAAALRPSGLAFVPQTDRPDSISLKIVPIGSTKEVWPIGWPNDRPLMQFTPMLFKSVPVEIVDTPLSEALAALRPRLELPVLIDHRGLASRKIHLDQVRVRYPAGKPMYKRLMDRILFQARLEMEIRVDEGDRPLIWIEPLHR